MKNDLIKDYEKAVKAEKKARNKSKKIEKSKIVYVPPTPEAMLENLKKELDRYNAHCMAIIPYEQQGPITDDFHRLKALTQAIIRTLELEKL